MKIDGKEYIFLVRQHSPDEEDQGWVVGAFYNIEDAIHCEEENNKEYAYGVELDTLGGFVSIEPDALIDNSYNYYNIFKIEIK